MVGRDLTAASSCDFLVILSEILETANYLLFTRELFAGSIMVVRRNMLRILPSLSNQPSIFSACFPPTSSKGSAHISAFYGIFRMDHLPREYYFFANRITDKLLS